MTDPGYHDLPSNSPSKESNRSADSKANEEKRGLSRVLSLSPLYASHVLLSFAWDSLAHSLLLSCLMASDEPMIEILSFPNRFNPSLSFYWMSYRAFSLQVQNASKEDLRPVFSQGFFGREKGPGCLFGTLAPERVAGADCDDSYAIRG